MNNKPDEEYCISFTARGMTKAFLGIILMMFLVILYVNEKYQQRLEKGIESANRRKPDSPFGKDFLSFNTTLQPDFRNRASPIPKEKWIEMDNDTCIKQNVSDFQLQEWQHRAPFVQIIGAMKAGTTALSTYLRQHSHVLQTKQKEIHFFDFHFENYSTRAGILQAKAQAAYSKVFEAQANIPRLQEDPTMIAIDDSPRYLFWSDRVPSRVLCVSPWVKILAILRNPIDRAFSQFNMHRNKRLQLNGGMDFTFKQWIEKDIQDLKNSGVIQDKVPLSKFIGSPQEMQAWKAYTRLGTHSPIGRGLYAIQLRHWFTAFDKAGKSRNDIYIVKSEDMERNTSSVYAELLSFLNLPQEPLRDDKQMGKATYMSKMNIMTRKYLEAFFEPYNKELNDLLGNNWTRDWNN
jgi:Sulfotransferase domain